MSRYIKLKKSQFIKDHVIDLGIIKEINYDKLITKLNKNFESTLGGCSVAYKAINKNKEFIVGRNMDLSISNNPAYIMRTNIKNEYKTIGISYNCFPSQTYENILKKGLLTKEYLKAPFFCTDVFNEKGLYFEINMRNYEAYPNGEPKYVCTSSKYLEIKEYNESLHNFKLLEKFPIDKPRKRICIAFVPRYLAGKCATIDDVIEELKYLDVFSPNGIVNWNFCLFIADSKGNHGVLELARGIFGQDNSMGKLVFIKDAIGQTNFYLNPEFSFLEEYKSGIGRFNKIKEMLPSIKNEKDMFNLMDTISYNQIYIKDEWANEEKSMVKDFNSHCKFDKTSEFVSFNWWITNGIIQSGIYQDDIEVSINQICERYESKSLQQIRDEAKYWQSSLTIITNCSKKTMHVRFFEDNDYKFDKENDTILKFNF